MKPILLLSASLLTSSTVLAAPTANPQFSSGETKVQLIELYTSQGCSSCPPAEKLLSSYSKKSALWQSIIPIAFHVDYWDYLGWKDIFSTAKATQRQRDHRSFNNIRSVYTPAFVIDGREWRGYFTNAAAPQPSTEKVGNLTLDWHSASQTAHLIFDNLSPMTPRYCHAAILGLGQHIKIQSGENRGKTLPQDFTALSFNVSDSEVKNGKYQCNVQLPDINSAIVAPQQYAIVSWMSSRTGVPIQATGGLFKPTALLPRFSQQHSN